MFRYLKAAFLARVNLPGLGGLPMNVVLCAAMAILGFGHPAFWLLGVGLETAYLVGLATNGRFQNVVDAQAFASSDGDAQSKRQQIISQLTAAGQAQMTQLQAKCDRAVTVAREQGIEDYIIESNGSALDKLAWLYLKLLLARQNLMAQERDANIHHLYEQVAQLERELADPHLGPSLRESKTATLQILHKRVENFQRREQSLKEIGSDLMRIDAQVELAAENAGMGNAPQAISSNISLVSGLLAPDLFGDSQSAVADLDQTFGGGQKGASA